MMSTQSNKKTLLPVIFLGLFFRLIFAVSCLVFPKVLADLAVKITEHGLSDISYTNCFAILTTLILSGYFCSLFTNKAVYKSCILMQNSCYISLGFACYSDFERCDFETSYQIINNTAKDIPEFRINKIPEFIISLVTILFIFYKMYIYNSLISIVFLLFTTLFLSLCFLILSNLDKLQLEQIESQNNYFSKALIMLG